MSTRNLYQEKIFGGSVYKTVPLLQKHQPKIDMFLENQAALCQELDVSQYAEGKKSIKASEQKLEDHFPTTESLFAHTVKTNKKIGESYFLSDMAIERLLYAHPPVTLQKYLSRQPGVTLPARALLSLTRFTEDAVWQYTYIQLLNKTTAKDYELRQPTYFQIDASLYLEVISIYNHHIKPWHVSHAKETGTILHFVGKVPKNDVQTPLLLSGAVALHYLFEVTAFGEYIRNRVDSGLPLTVEKIILRKAPIMPFLTDGNVHDETLYWRRAWKQVGVIFSEISEELVCQNNIGILKDEVYSLHPVDLLWDVNNIYPNKLNKYHLQQDSWLQLLQHASQLSDFDFEDLVLNNLTCNNYSFAELCLQS